MDAEVVRGSPTEAASGGVSALFVAVSHAQIRRHVVDVAYRHGVAACVAPTLEMFGAPQGAVLVADGALVNSAPSRWLKRLLAAVSIGDSASAAVKVYASRERFGASAQSFVDELVEHSEKSVLSVSNHSMKRAHLRVPPVELELRSRAAWVDGQPLQLRRAELNVLHYLMVNLDRVVPPQELVTHVLGTTGSGGSARTQVCELRRKLAELGAEGVVETVRGSGYRFVRRAGV